jgi:hypothetical protein
VWWWVTCGLVLPLSVLEAGIFVVHAQYLVTDELSAMLREGAGLLKTRRDLALRMVECRKHHMCLRMGYGDADRG